MISPAPRYRVTGDRSQVVPINSVLYLGNSEFDDRGWPRHPRVEPVNDLAREIYGYYRSAESVAHWLPPTPFDEHDELYLPPVHALGQQGTTFLGVPAEAPKGAPLYRVTALSVETSQGTARRGETFAFYGWPRAGIEPANALAQRIFDYLEAHRWLKIPPAPWNLATDAPYLPGEAPTRSARVA
jgi:hypothetical protein